MPTYRDSRGRWRYQFTVNYKKYSGSSPKGRNTERVAAELERQHIDRVSNRRYAGVMPTVADFVPRFLEYQKHHTKQLTHELHETICTLHVVPTIGKKPLDEVRRAELDALVLRWGCAPRTANTRLGVVMRMLSLAKEWEILESVPDVKYVKVPKYHPRFLSDVEAHALLQAATALWWTMIFTGLRTGLRIGELRGLKWGDIEIRKLPDGKVHAVVHVRRTDPGRPDMDPNGPKGNRPRTVPLSPELIAALENWHKTSQDKDPDDWVFPGAPSWRDQHNRDRTRSGSNCVVMIKRFAKDAGLKGVTWHTLRHTFASKLVMLNVPLSAVQELLGHASIKQTERYAHLAPGFAQHAAIALLDLPMMQPGDQAALPAVKPLALPGAKKPVKVTKGRIQSQRPPLDRPNVQRYRRPKRKKDA